VARLAQFIQALWFMGQRPNDIKYGVLSGLGELVSGMDLVMKIWQSNYRRE
jgi:hypothetical protein